MCGPGTTAVEKNLFDIGCAYGPFLAAASESSFNTFGTDISDDAISYVQSKLKMPAVCSAFPDIDTAEEFGIAQFLTLSMLLRNSCCSIPSIKRKST